MSTSESQDPVESRVGLQDLPEETLAQVVALVADQEAEIRSTGLSVAPRPSSAGQSGASGSVQNEGFSNWYLHGVGALSVVNKKMRRLTLPHLCKIITCAQLAAPIVQFRDIPPELLGGIRTLDLRNALEETFVAAAKVLPRLTGIHKITSHQIWDIYVPRHELAESAFAKLADKVDTLVLFGFSGTRGRLLGRVDAFVKPAVLRRLDLYTVDPAFDSPWLSGLLAEYEGLETLKIFGHDGNGSSAFDIIRRQPQWAVLPVLASLRELRLKSTGLHVLRFVAELAPNVEHLEILFDDNAAESNEIEAVSLPRLRTLDISGDVSCLLSLGLVNLMPVTFLNIRINRPSTGIVDIEPFLPDRLLLSSALEVHFCHKTLVTVDNIDLLIDLCDAQGATYRAFVHGLLEPFRPSVAPVDVEESSDEEEEGASEEGSSSDGDARDSPAEAYLRQLATSILGTKRWALERAVELGAANDVVGLVELAETLRKVEERRILEEI
ncbi:hypothetical protein JCM8208_004897 [Rhodotorula glutinis]